MVEREPIGERPKARQSEATNIYKKILKKELLCEKANRIFDEFKVNLNEYNLVMLTLHPYKDKKFDKFRSLSKMSDRLRKKIKTFFIVQEPNADIPHVHYHVLAVMKKDQPPLAIKGVKIWQNLLQPFCRPSHPFTPVRELFDEFMLGHDEEMPETFKEYKKPVQEKEGSAYGKAYCQAKRTIQDQRRDIIKYMTKLDTEQHRLMLYKEYLFTGFY